MTALTMMLRTRRSQVPMGFSSMTMCFGDQWSTGCACVERQVQQGLGFWRLFFFPFSPSGNISFEASGNKMQKKRV